VNTKTPGLESSPQAYARAGGLLYLYIIVAAMFAEAFVRGKLIVSGDAATTANNILAHETLFRLGFAADLSNLACDIVLAVILYVLTRPVNRNLALMALFMKVAADVINIGALLFMFVGLRILVDGGFLAGFDPQQVQALALFMFKLHASGFTVSMVFFGLGLIFLGYLIYKSGYFPKFLGVLLLISGPLYLFNSFARFLAPPVADAFFPWTLLPGFIAELALCLWLLIKGVDLPKWRERAHSSG
jgi:Domain of unknown function (DUF4386)